MTTLLIMDLGLWKVSDGFPSLTHVTIVLPTSTAKSTLCKDASLAEVLAHQIEDEEPGACVIISRAMNLKQEVALQQTELQAWDALTSEITLQANRNFGQRVCFESVRAAVAAELDTLADDPDLIAIPGRRRSFGSGIRRVAREGDSWAPTPARLT